jgi:hypothetical protein
MFEIKKKLFYDRQFRICKLIAKIIYINNLSIFETVKYLKSYYKFNKRKIFFINTYSTI